MKTVFKTIISICVILISNTFSFASFDIDTVYNRMYKSYLTNPTKGTVDNVLTLMNADGSFSDLSYNQNTTEIAVHLTRINNLASAFKNPVNTYYNNANIKQKYYTSINYWITKNHTTTNWWFRHIGYPQAMDAGFLILGKDMKTDNLTLFNNCVTYLRWAYLQNDHMDGANGADKIIGALPASVLTETDAELTKYTTQIKSLIVVQDLGEGIEVDQMFAQHSGYGRQLYANYQIEYLQSCIQYLSYVKKTGFDVTVAEYKVLEEHHLNGVQWYVYKKHIDPAQTGRKPSSQNGYGGTKGNINELVKLNTPQVAKMQVVNDRISNGATASTQLSGNSMFWRFDYMIHRRSNFYFSSRAISTRTVGLESGNGEGNNNYHGGSGLNFIFRTGNEYNNPYFTNFNFRQFPGTTVEQDNATLPLVNWGSGATGTNTFSGGASDGNFGCMGYDHNRRGVKAKKSWFYFDNEMVALGNNITQTAGTASVFTTINQCLQNGTISYSKSGTTSTITTASGTTNVTNPDWILQDSIGYINLIATSNFKISSDTKTGNNYFTCGIDHGTNPTNQTYAYIVLPNTSSTSLNAYKSANPIQVLANTSTVQAVYHKNLKITQAIFYTAGSLTLANGNVITVSIPSAIVIKDTNSTYQITVGNPQCESSNPASMTVSINTQLTGTYASWDGTKTTLTFALPQGDYAGQSVSKTFYIGDCAPAFASVDDGNIAENTMDNNLSTRWSAQGDGQSITFCLGTSKTINRVDIAFFSGDIRVSTFDILVSINGTTWTNAALGLKSSGKSTALEAFTFLPQTGKYVKIVGHGNSSNLWNSYCEVQFPSNVIPTVAFTAPTNNAVFTTPTNITFDVTASDVDGTVSKVEFYNGTTYIGNDLTSPYSFTWNNVAEGIYTISAKAIDNAGGVKYASVKVNVTGILTDIETEKVDNKLLYPNPTQGILFVSKEIEKIHIYDLNNKLVKSFDTSVAEKIDISNFSSGVYQVKIELQNGEKRNVKIMLDK